MLLTQLYIQNFMSIQQVTLNLDNRGMTLILGENLDNQDFDNNGAGKSTLTEALTYVLYGKTLRGLKGDDIVNKTSKRNCKVMLDLVDDDGTQYRISRYRKHKDNGNKFFLFRNGKDITPKSESDFTQAITDILNMDFLTFTSSILYSAQSFKFTTATDAEMKNAFDTMLGLDMYSSCQEEAKEELKQLNYQKQTLNTKLDSLRQQVDGLNEQLITYRQLQEDYEAEKEEELEDLSAEIEDKQKEKAQCAERLEQVKKDLKAIEKVVKEKEKALKAAEKALESLDEIKEGITECKDELRDNEGLINKVNSQISTLQRDIQRDEKAITKCDIKIEQIQDKVQESEDTVGTPCPLCGNKITHESIDAVIEQYASEIEALESEKAEYQESIYKHKTKIVTYEEQIQKLDNVNAEIKEDLSVLEAALEKGSKYSKEERRCRTELDEVNSKSMKLNLTHKNLQAEEDRIALDVTNLERKYKKKQDEVNPYSQLIEDTQRKIFEMEKGCEKDKESLLLLEKDERVLQFWIQGFSNSGIKSLLLDDITPFLNRRANKYLRKLSSDHMEIKFSTQSTLKSGEKREKFTIEVVNNDGGDTYIANSSGEKRRIDIAVNLALQDLIAARSSKKLNIAFFDEVFDTLDSVGVEKVVDLLQDMAKEKSSLFVITHNNDLKSLFTNSIKIVKQGGYSTLVEE